MSGSVSLIQMSNDQWRSLGQETAHGQPVTISQGTECKTAPVNQGWQDPTLFLSIKADRLTGPHTVPVNQGWQDPTLFLSIKADRTPHCSTLCRQSEISDWVQSLIPPEKGRSLQCCCTCLTTSQFLSGLQSEQDSQQRCAPDLLKHKDCATLHLKYVSVVVKASHWLSKNYLVQSDN